MALWPAFEEDMNDEYRRLKKQRAAARSKVERQIETLEVMKEFWKRMSGKSLRISDHTDTLDEVADELRKISESGA